MPSKDYVAALLVASIPIQSPPVLPEIDQELDQYLTSPENLAIHDFERYQSFIPRTPCYETIYSLDVTSVQTGIEVERDQATGKLLGYREEILPDVGISAKNSTSLQRLPESAGNGIFGSTTNYPFWPGGLDEPDLDALKAAATLPNSTAVDFVNDLLTCPPGFKEGVQFERCKFDGFLSDEAPKSVISIADVLNMSRDIEFATISTDDVAVADSYVKTEDVVTSIDVDVDEVVKLDGEHQSLVSSEAKGAPQVTEEYAVVIDISKPVRDFKKQLPDMAIKYPFELDTFQKQAILHLERHENVFVAAHTSAGKTVVAEYAIALAQKHMTKAIYTSPIKALSNQKFREFKDKFTNVGLVTGDVQIRPEAECLIMTTEILRSMLYRGSDVIRDLEWVIFDEVHYINDRDRGVVWEEVLIMLPQHISIVMLSATVPNTKEFAEWVGRTKKRKVYVVSTTERPVPLEHYLYTGNSNKTTHELFMLLNSKRDFLVNGHNKAVEAKKERATKSSYSFGAKGVRHNITPQQDKNIWLSVIEMLKKNDSMPAVAFIFSKKRIRETTELLVSVNLVDNHADRGKIHKFFEQSIARLKGTDRRLPQVLQLRHLLERGIGIHHSGVLPILKEVVELLFQQGLVKILFATETFAMGVNMPARTVIFDTMRKFDGTSFRDLLPGEYIQMAGRAGRRGLDPTGTVILLCKGDVPEMADLHRMMLGKPTQLQSQFRLTYSMILSLLRVEQIRMEDMMKRSFGEFHTQKDANRNAERLKVLESQIRNLQNVFDFSGDLERYYESCKEYFCLRESIQKNIYSQHIGLKILVPGRVIVVDKPKYRNTPAVILEGTVKDKFMKALVLTDASKSEQQTADDLELDVLPRPVIDQSVFIPEGQCLHAVVDVSVEDIAVVSSKILKISADKIMSDVRKREQPRFRNDPPGQSIQLATQELLRFAESNAGGFPSIHPIDDLHIKDIDLVQDVKRYLYLADTLSTFRCIHDIKFEENFKQFRRNEKIREEYSKVKAAVSDESLVLLPEYQQRVKVLQQLRYINNDGMVELKGRVACELISCGGHELLLTELVFSNAFVDLGPAELAAMLSCLVFDDRRCEEPNLTPLLFKARDLFVATTRNVAELQIACGLRQVCADEDVESLHFGLVEVVYEWARGMPFCKVTELSDVEEGNIVRCIQQLDECLRDVKSAARLVGDPVLQKKAQDASCAIKRDIVFAASLYTQ